MKDFFSYAENITVDNYSFAAYINLGCTSLDGFFEELAVKLKFPYWGHNWDSFDENIKVLDWIREEKIYLIHKNKWALEEADFKIYIQLLREAISLWNHCNEHKLIVSFPLEYQKNIERLGKKEF